MPWAQGYLLQESYVLRVRRLLMLGGDFCTPREVRLTRRAQGGDAWVHVLDNRKAFHDLANVLTGIEDLEDVEICLTLHHEDPTCAGEQSLLDGATAWLMLESDSNGEVPWLRLQVALHTDLYAARTGAVNRDNTAVALCNAPRLERFLCRLESDLEAQLVGIDAPAYQGQVYRHGFRLPGADPAP